MKLGIWKTWKQELTNNFLKRELFENLFYAYTIFTELSNDSYSTAALGGEEGSPAGGASNTRFGATPPYLRAHSPPHAHYHYPPDHLVYTNIG